MKTVHMCLIAMGAAILLSMFGLNGADAQKEKTVRRMNITGKIVQEDSGYIIRGKLPSELFRILNPEPTLLEPLAKSGKVVMIVVRIVVGDNVEIEKIGSMTYRVKKPK